MAPALLSPELAASNTAFFVIFGVFVVAFVVLAFITVRWAIRRDRSGRQAWEEQRQTKSPPVPPGPTH
jgi:hypothetical protein